LKHFLCITALALLSSVPVFSQVTCQTYGNQTNCSNGLSATHYGNQITFSDGTTATYYGNQTTFSDGTTSSRYGNQTTFSTGITCTTFGTQTTCSDGTTASRYGNQTTVYGPPQQTTITTTTNSTSTVSDPDYAAAGAGAVVVGVLAAKGIIGIAHAVKHHDAKKKEQQNARLHLASSEQKSFCAVNADGSAIGSVSCHDHKPWSSDQIELK
jgi:hypothetical protein